MFVWFHFSQLSNKFSISIWSWSRNLRIVACVACILSSCIGIWRVSGKLSALHACSIGQPATPTDSFPPPEAEVHMHIHLHCSPMEITSNGDGFASICIALDCISLAERRRPWTSDTFSDMNSQPTKRGQSHQKSSQPTRLPNAFQYALLSHGYSGPAI